MLRILGALCVMAGSGGFGHLIAKGLDDRSATLRRLVTALQHLESDISFAALPLLAALRRVAATLGGVEGAFFTAAAEEIGACDGRPLASAWLAALNRYKLEMLLAPDEVDALAQLGTVLGGSDREDQLKHLALAKTTLARHHAEAEAGAVKAKRVWRYLGFTFGAMIVILLY
ncbi:MAG: hypothetical protein ACM3ZC_15045 [Bacteroidota bacterium]